MSEQLRHKMIDFEATPPPAAWKTIAARLDDDVQYAAVATKMNNFNATPSSGVWNNIAERLDDDAGYAGVATRINNFGTIPTQSSWSAIAARLDDDIQYAAIATKMNNFDAVPPSQIWNSIAASLQETTTQTTRVLPVRRIIYRIAAAAVIAGLFVGGWMLLNKNNPEIEVVKNNGNIPTVHSAPHKDTNTSTGNISTAPTTVVTADENLHQTGQEDTKKHLSLVAANIGNNISDRLLKYAVVSDVPAYHKAPIVIAYSPILDKEGNVIRDMDVLTTSNYIMVTGPNGQSTRISSKFASVIRYLDGTDSEEYLDKVIRESDTWKKRFQEWRNKISQSAFIPSSANFLDIIEFKDLIQEKQ